MEEGHELHSESVINAARGLCGIIDENVVQKPIHPQEAIRSPCTKSLPF